MITSTDITTKTFTFRGRPYRVTSFRGGPLEVYRVEETGLEMCEGYAFELKDVDLAQAAFDAFQGAPGQRWLFDVGSERFHIGSDGRVYP